MKEIIIDTNGFLRFVLDDIPTQKVKIEGLLKKAKKSELVIHVPQIVIFEIQFSLDKYYKFDKEKIIGLLHSLVSANFLDIESRDIFLSALPIYKKSSVSFVDSFLYAAAEVYNAELFTFDRKLLKMKES